MGLPAPRRWHPCQPEVVVVEQLLPQLVVMPLLQLKRRKRRRGQNHLMKDQMMIWDSDSLINSIETYTVVERKSNKNGVFEIKKKKGFFKKKKKKKKKKKS